MKTTRIETLVNNVATDIKVTELGNMVHFDARPKGINQSVKFAVDKQSHKIFIAGHNIGQINFYKCCSKRKRSSKRVKKSVVIDEKNLTKQLQGEKEQVKKKFKEQSRINEVKTSERRSIKRKDQQIELKVLSVEQTRYLTWSNFWIAMKFILSLIVIVVGLYFNSDLIKSVAISIENSTMWNTITTWGGVALAGIKALNSWNIINGNGNEK